VIFREDGTRYTPIKLSVRGRDLESTVAEAQAKVGEKIKLGDDTQMDWGGEINELREAQIRLALIIPATLLVIALLVYGSVRSVPNTLTDLREHDVADELAAHGRGGRARREREVAASGDQGITMTMAPEPASVEGLTSPVPFAPTPAPPETPAPLPCPVPTLVPPAPEVPSTPAVPLPSPPPVPVAPRPAAPGMPPLVPVPAPTSVVAPLPCSGFGVAFAPGSPVAPGA